MIQNKFVRRIAVSVSGMSLLLAAATTQGAVTLAQAPLLTAKAPPGLMMLTMGRDLSFYRAAFNDVSDLDGDGVIDAHFKPTFTYDGYFAPDRCYAPNNGRFEPTALASGAARTCSGTWSGNFMNWLTMSRMDVIRKVLFGGKRSTDAASYSTADPSTGTVLERSYTPQDSTLWGKEYTSVSVDGYSIADYTPLPLPDSGTRHMFANATPLLAAGDSTKTAVDPFTTTPQPPMLFVYKNVGGGHRIWDISASDRGGAYSAILGYRPEDLSSVGGIATAFAFYQVRVLTCVPLGPNNALESNCVGYPRSASNPTSFKPTGVLQQYGENQNLAFGLITGSYDNNYGGGVLRSNIDDFNQEINPATGQFTVFQGIVNQISSLRPWGFGTDNRSKEATWDCGYNWAAPRVNGECRMWGNPLGEMMYEGLRYFAGKSAGTSAFTNLVGNPQQPSNTNWFPKTFNSPEKPLGLQLPGWQNPYAAPATGVARKAAYPICSRPSQMVIGNPSTSYDSDQLPGSYFTAITPGFGRALTGDTLAGLNVSTEGDLIWAREFGRDMQFFVGQSGAVRDGNPSAKTVTSFGNIRGMAPNDTTSEGSFYGASVARFGKATGVPNPAISGSNLKIDQYSVALDSHIPQIVIPVASGTRRISIVPLAKTVGGQGINPAPGNFQTTSPITGFFIDYIYNAPGYPQNGAFNGGRPEYQFKVFYSDNEQGSDNETDAQSTYNVKVMDDAQGTISVGINFDGGGNAVEMHLGYVVGGTMTDGLFLDVGATNATSNATTNYFLDTPQRTNGLAMAKSTLSSPRGFTAGSAGANAAQSIPHDMLWYAAKYGDATYDTKGNATFNLNAPTGPGVDADPSNYYYARNPSLLASQIGQAFQKAAALSVATTAGVSGSGTQVAGDSLVYVGTFDSINWGGNVVAKALDANAEISSTSTWTAADGLLATAQRSVLLGTGGTTTTKATSLSYSSLSAGQKTAFQNDSTFKYLMGDRSNEAANGGRLRNRTSAFGDVVNSEPLYVGKANFGYSNATYAAFSADNFPRVVAVGSNDGYFHVMSALTGEEKLAFMPLAAQPSIANLAQTGYTHQYFVDGLASFGHVLNAGTWRTVVAGSTGAGGKSVFAVDVTDGTAPAVLWEYSDKALGNVLNKPIVGLLENQTGVVIVGNGLNSSLNQASLTVLNARTGALVQQCTPGTSTTNPVGNGMTAIASVSTAGSGKVSYVYAADYRGNLWRIDPNVSTCGADSVLIFKASTPTGESQPITGEMSVTAAPSGKTGSMILFGTGSYLNQSDSNDTTIQTMYGVWDDWSVGLATATRASLVLQQVNGGGSTIGTRTTSTNDQSNGGNNWYDTAKKRGWALDLTCAACTPGERSIGKPVLIGLGAAQTVSFLSLVPGTDPCVPSGGSWLTTLNAQSGGYVNAYADAVPNSVYVPGSAGKGIFVAAKATTTTNASVLTIIVSRNITSGTTDPAFGTKTGSQVDGNGTGTDFGKFNIVNSNTKRTNTVRQIWRQLQ